MSKIDAHPKTIREVLSVKYAIDYYQREYKWETKQVGELIDDLEAKFLSSYEADHERKKVQHYSPYFLGSFVLSLKDGERFIIDGQQRLTSLSLLLIFLQGLLLDSDQKGDVQKLIFSLKYGDKSFNLQVPEREECMNALFTGEGYDATGKPESVRNVAARYADIEELFPDTLKNGALPYFVDWLLDNVYLVEIAAGSDDDAYAIFETMNDRGLSLSPTDMLKGYLLANIEDDSQKAAANTAWKQRIVELMDLGKEEEADFLKAWLRAKYANSIRERKKGATNKDWDKIGTSFHKWVREEKETVKLRKSGDFRDFVTQRFDRFAKHHLRLRQAAKELTPGLEAVYYNAHNNFTLQYPLLLAPLRLTDDVETVTRKVQLVAAYLDIFIARRIVNFRTLGYSAIVYTMFNLVKDIRDLEVDQLRQVLKDRLAGMEETFDGVSSLYMHQQNRYHVHYLLARITRHVEEQSSVESSFVTYVSREIKKPFEVEHIWADKYAEHPHEFDSEARFREYRNRFGGLLLVPRGFNQSFGAAPFAEKVKNYYGQNLLAKSLNEQCYRKDPSFLSYAQRSGLPFQPYRDAFTPADLDERQDLYRLLCEEIWAPARLDEVTT